MRSLKNYLFIPLVLFFNLLMGQNYQAINGSPYAGSLSPGNNPASIVQVPFSWDITPFSVQLKQSTNAFIIKNYSLFSSPKNATFVAQSGTLKRFVFSNQDIRLLNTRINLNSKSAIAFGANIRNYFYTTTSKSNWQDTLFTLRDFMKISNNYLPLSGESRSSTWAEVYAAFAHTIIDDGKRILTAGITVKINRTLAAEYVDAKGVGYIPEITANVPGYLLTTGSLQYGYSANFDKIDSSKTASANRKNFLQNTQTGFSLDAGLEYILLSDDDDEEVNDFAYKTKIGISIMDVGRNKFQHGGRSSSANIVNAGITDTVLENKFRTVGSFNNFNDSLATISGSFSQLNGGFNIYMPARLMINVDHHLVNNFFINAELTLPVLSLIPKKIKYIKDMNLLAVTPRWETKSLGVYLPFLVNNKKQVWVGGAFRAGPVLFGTHNLANLFSKNKFQLGGFYFALTIRPGKKYNRQANTPKVKLSRKVKRSLSCPKF